MPLPAFVRDHKTPDPQVEKSSLGLGLESISRREIFKNQLSEFVFAPSQRLAEAKIISIQEMDILSPPLTTQICKETTNLAQLREIFELTELAVARVAKIAPDSQMHRDLNALQGYQLRAQLAHPEYKSGEHRKIITEEQRKLAASLPANRTENVRIYPNYRYDQKPKAA